MKTKKKIKKLVPEKPIPTINLSENSITFSGVGSILNMSKVNEFSLEIEGQVKNKTLDIDKFCLVISEIKNIDWALELITCAKIYYNNHRDDIAAQASMQNIMAELFRYYPYESYCNTRALKAYKIQKISDQKFIYTLEEGPYVKQCVLSERKAKQTADIKEAFLNRLEAYIIVLTAAGYNKHTKTVEEVVKEMLKNVGVFSKILKGDSEKYHKFAGYICSVIEYLAVGQTQCIMALKAIWSKNYSVLSKLSNTLLNNKQYSFVIELLASELPDIEDNVTEDKEIAFCHNNIARGYRELGEYDNSEIHYLQALKTLPGNSGIILSLVEICQLNNNPDKAEALIKQMPRNAEQALLEIANNNWRKISVAKLNEINKVKFSEHYLHIWETVRYIALYNEGAFNTNKQIKAGLKEIQQILPNNKSLHLRLALHTEHFEEAEKIVKKFPQAELIKYKSLQLFRIYFEPYTVKIICESQEYTRQEVVEAINTANNCLIATSEKDNSSVVLKNVEESLKYDPKNEETLECGIVAALLNKKPDKVKEYASQLLGEEARQNIISKYSKNEDKLPKTIEELIEEHDPKKIHEYYQQKKQYEFEQLSKKIINNNTEEGVSKWKSKEGLEISDAVYAGHYKELDCWASIDPKIEKKLDPTTALRYNNALNKGITYRDLGQNGVKFIENKIAELKINDDFRLFTTSLHVSNNTGDNKQVALILFDRQGNHEEVNHFIAGSSGLIYDEDWQYIS